MLNRMRNQGLKLKRSHLETERSMESRIKLQMSFNKMNNKKVLFYMTLAVLFCYLKVLI